MAERAPAAPFDLDDPTPSPLGRTLLWAGLAAVTLAGAVVATQTQPGAQRMTALFSHPPPPPPVVEAPRPPPGPSLARITEAEAEARRLAEAVRLLAADRDRLAARVEALEHNADVTGALRDNPPWPPAVAPLGVPPVSALPPTWSALPGVTASNPPATIPAAPAPLAATGPGPANTPVGATAPPPQPAGRAAGNVSAIPDGAAESVATKTEFGVDVGGNRTVEGLRSLWTALKNKHPALFQGLRPVIAIREGTKGVELRLVIGPLTNAGAAARLCATLAAAGLACQPTVFDGQRLALN